LQKQRRAAPRMNAWPKPLARWLCTTGGGVSDEWQEAETTGQVQEQLDTSRFKGWNYIPPGFFNSAPALASVNASATVFDAYGRGLDNAIYYNYWSDLTGWLGWTSIGGTWTSKPAATVFGSSQRMVVAKGSDNAIWANWTTGVGHSGFQGWLRISSTVFDTAPAITYMSPYLFAVARKSDSKVYWTRNDVSGGYNHANWTAWDDIPVGTVTSEPAITAKSGRIVVAAKGQDNAFWIISSTNNGNTWSPAWSKVGSGIFKSAPALTYHGSSVELVGQGTDNFMWAATANPTDGATGAWAQIPAAKFTSGPAIAANIGSASGKLALVGKTGDHGRVT
jgi:hypothetical protein